ncbi:hypothetical protein Poly30_34840 [Planctomycetes bacterium Poly30]|uniref:Uncharacterized protein n=1 Tax=Saltatorellus ferox TaxID=2528018 RepID=A0A518EV68_9BACT|nr:hypothetical protein Poly30_34840 [Planctomycetes bacterium Poly30]
MGTPAAGEAHRETSCVSIVDTRLVISLTGGFSFGDEEATSDQWRSSLARVFPGWRRP